jgi:hypothetical protein
MAGYPTEQQSGANTSAPDLGNGPGHSHSYYDDTLDWMSEKLVSASSSVESGWNATKQEASAIEAGIEAGAEYLYKEADQWVKQLLGAKTWSELHHIANVLLGPESFYLGVTCGVVKNLGETAFGLIGLLKMLVLAGLYEELHGSAVLVYSTPQSAMLRAAGWVFDKMIGKQMKDADTQLKGIFSEVGKIFKEPAKFFGAAWASASGDYVKKWREFERLAKTGRAVDQFKAGEIAGEVLTTVVLTILAIVSGVGAAIRTTEAVVGGVRALIGAAEVTEEAAAALSKEAPELVKAARGLEDAKPAGTSAGEVEAAPAKPKPYSNPKSRPKYADDQVQKVWDAAKQSDGKVYDPNTGEELTWDPNQSRAGQWDMGHKPGNEYWRLHEDYMDGKISKEEFLQKYRDPDNYQPESPSANRSHRWEDTSPNQQDDE